MDDIKMSIAHNIARLRQLNKMTQLELAERLNYSDKAVSKWERGDATPDVTVLANVAALFGVSLDYLIKEHEWDEKVPIKANEKLAHKNHSLITGMSILLVWLIATLIFVVLHISCPSIRNEWLAFVMAVPVSLIVWLVLNSIWFNRKRNFLIISLLMWTLLVVMFVCFLLAGYNTWLIFMLGIPGQIITILWYNIGRGKKSEFK